MKGQGLSVRVSARFRRGFLVAHPNSRAHSQASASDRSGHPPATRTRPTDAINTLPMRNTLTVSGSFVSGLRSPCGILRRTDDRSVVVTHAASSDMREKHWERVGPLTHSLSPARSSVAFSTLSPSFLPCRTRSTHTRTHSQRNTSIYRHLHMLGGSIASRSLTHPHAPPAQPPGGGWSRV